MKNLLVRDLHDSAINAIEKRAKVLGISRNMLLIDVLEEYAKRISENEAANTLKTQMDLMIENQNRLIESHNNSTERIVASNQDVIQAMQRLIIEFGEIKNQIIKQMF
ncbi:hypothetical protein WOSG25_110780 [Weissella oryzae SG25]|uniref:Uncharacterized protein n=1 Tax=Weissella oryzae (strain DSM 25784 / JCM 18191 / LMG 30913 / SG25) TaxID=1329250 RepID=A0A069CUV7_WEIOS|nr:hypothetical protein [Weissella oryzae]GAK31600.1 hypothetical protein WOSG25_110780 [Weissella oryzae SG25]